MSKPKFWPEFKEEAVRQVAERWYSVADAGDLVFQRIAFTTESNR